MTTIHPTAIVDSGATLGEDVDVGPFAIIEAGANVGDRTRIFSSAYIAGGCEIGADCEIHVGTVIGGPAQMRIMHGPGGRISIGDHTILREHVTVHRSIHEDGVTRVGSRCFLLVNSHVAHDCVVGDDVTLANGALLAGHVTVGDRTFISGNAGVHQFVRVGRLVMIGGASRVAKDVLPFTLVVNDSEVYGLNVVGMRRAGLTEEQRAEIKRAYRTIYRSGLNVSSALDVLRTNGLSPLVRELIEFAEGSTRGLCAAGPRGSRMRSAIRQGEDDPDLGLRPE
jgi:UDP-N-acetylglucosamine acyltransferase